MRGRRKTLRISEAEWSIMKVLWENAEKTEAGMTLGEIVQKLAEPTGWSDTTIRTLIIRLAEKNAVKIDKTSGVYEYTSNTPKDECVKYEVDSFVKRVFDDSRYDLMASLVRECELSDEQKKKIIDIISTIKD
ncbi:MAG: BlaI/MecI/CopY family transcriptional regulator [Clostridia bacterium]|nr:BlaI/MecI/CopY family transcriptional regulator [Clostridia bacterium]